MISPNVIWHQY